MFQSHGSLLGLKEKVWQKVKHTNPKDQRLDPAMEGFKNLFFAEVFWFSKWPGLWGVRILRATKKQLPGIYIYMYFSPMDPYIYQQKKQRPGDSKWPFSPQIHLVCSNEFLFWLMCVASRCHHQRAWTATYGWHWNVWAHGRHLWTSAGKKHVHFGEGCPALFFWCLI